MIYKMIIYRLLHGVDSITWSLPLLAPVIILVEQNTNTRVFFEVPSRDVLKLRSYQVR